HQVTKAWYCPGTSHRAVSAMVTNVPSPVRERPAAMMTALPPQREEKSEITWGGRRFTAFRLVPGAKCEPHRPRSAFVEWAVLHWLSLFSEALVRMKRTVVEHSEPPRRRGALARRVHRQ